MFPSSVNHNNNGCFPDQLPFFSDITNTTSLSFSSFSIPSSPFYLYHDPDAFSQPVMDSNCAVAGDNATTDVVITEMSQKEKPKRRNVKKDRHSKINTAQGPRDRRMRLSLEVARKFFDLQDMLEFDKASKTVEWLLKQSKSAIKELSNRLNGKDGGSPCSSECDVVSGVFDEFMDGSQNSSAVNGDSDKVLKKEKKIGTRTQKCRGIVARESRKKARERAKERTMEKMSIRKQLIGTVEIVEESGTAAGNNYSYMKPLVVAQLDEAKDQLGQMDEQILGSCYSFTGTYGISQEQPFRDFQMLNTWDAYSNSTHLC